MKPQTTPPTAAKDEQAVFAFVHKFHNIAYASSLALRPLSYTNPYPSTISNESPSSPSSKDCKE